MRAVSVSRLKNNPAEALEQAKTDLLVVLNRDTPDALLVGLEKDAQLQAPGVKAALATPLFRDGELLLARVARMAGIDLASFSSHLSRLGIAAIRLTAAETGTDLDNLEQWLNASSATPGP